MTGNPAVPEGTSRTRAILLILVAMLAFAVQDTVVKVVAEQVSLWQLQTVRSVTVVLLLLLIVVAGSHLAQLRPGALGWPLMRSAALALAYILFYASLPFLALSEAAAAFYVAPLLITLLAALLLGEPVGLQRLGAVVLGFAGVVLILRPWSASWQPWALMPLAAAFCYALGTVITRWRCHDRPGLALTLVHNLLYVAIGLVALALVPILPPAAEERSEMRFLLSGWLPIGGMALLLMVSTAVSHLIGMLSSIRAYQAEEASRLAPFEYAYLAIIPVFDITVWGNVPDGPTLGGMALIGAGGMLVSLRRSGPARRGLPARSRLINAGFARDIKKR